MLTVSLSSVAHHLYLTKRCHLSGHCHSAPVIEDIELLHSQHPPDQVTSPNSTLTPVAPVPIHYIVLSSLAIIFSCSAFFLVALHIWK